MYKPEDLFQIFKDSMISYVKRQRQSRSDNAVVPTVANAMFNTGYDAALRDITRASRRSQEFSKLIGVLQHVTNKPGSLPDQDPTN